MGLYLSSVSRTLSLTAGLDYPAKSRVDVSTFSLVTVQLSNYVLTRPHGFLST